MSRRRRVLLDENLAVQLRLWMPGVEAVSVEFMGWKAVRNGSLVQRAKEGGFDVFVTADRALAMAPRSWAPLGCVLVTSNKLARLQASAMDIEAACRAVVPGQVVVVKM